jgi:hypothetical protein
MIINKSKSIKNIRGGSNNKQNDYNAVTNIHSKLKNQQKWLWNNQMQ